MNPGRVWFKHNPAVSVTHGAGWAGFYGKPGILIADFREYLMPNYRSADRTAGCF